MAPSATLGASQGPRNEAMARCFWARRRLCRGRWHHLPFLFLFFPAFFFFFFIFSFIFFFSWSSCFCYTEHSSKINMCVYTYVCTHVNTHTYQACLSLQFWNMWLSCLSKELRILQDLEEGRKCVNNHFLSLFVFSCFLKYTFYF